jgi:hypothetical protein
VFFQIGSGAFALQIQPAELFLCLAQSAGRIDRRGRVLLRLLSIITPAEICIQAAL